MKKTCSREQVSGVISEITPLLKNPNLSRGTQENICEVALRGECTELTWGKRCQTFSSKMHWCMHWRLSLKPVMTFLAIWGQREQAVNTTWTYFLSWYGELVCSCLFTYLAQSNIITHFKWYFWLLCKRTHAFNIHSFSSGFGLYQILREIFGFSAAKCFTMFTR